MRSRRQWPLVCCLRRSDERRAERQVGPVGRLLEPAPATRSEAGPVDNHLRYNYTNATNGKFEMRWPGAGPLTVHQNGTTLAGSARGPGSRVDG